MKRPRIQRSEIASLAFGLSESNVKVRNQWRIILALAAWIILSLITMLFTGDQLLTPVQRLIIIGMSFLKYLPLLYVAYAAAQSKAAKYLDDIFELQNQTLAQNFIEEVAFGGNKGKITINEGKISEKDELSPIILIGGPGKIKVNLGSAALLEQVDGDPEVIYAHDQAWNLKAFERIREIGEDDRVGKRQYAVINLRDQFVSGLSVSSRTKDGIPIEAQDIKIIFSVLRKPSSTNAQSEEDPYSFDERAVKSLVYKQTLITPPPANASGVSFPWDTTVIPLVTNELERLIANSALSQILSSISQKELDGVTENEIANTQIRVEITGEMTRASQSASIKVKQFESRSKITDSFFDKKFKDKAAELGVAIHWIDIGTWQLPHNMINERLKQAWEQARENIKRRKEIEGSRKKLENEKLLEIINTTVIDNFHKSPTASKSYDKDYGDYDELMKLIEKASEMKTETSRARQQEIKSQSAKEAFSVAREMLRAFRKEFLSAKELIQKENKPPLEKDFELARIEKTLREIETLLHPPKNPK